MQRMWNTLGSFVTMLVVLCLHIQLATPWSYFCDYKCGSEKHVVCELEPCKRNKLCGDMYAMEMFSNSDRYNVVKIHNDLRNKLASGNSSFGSWLTAANMEVLSYSRELEFVAQCWANNCNVDGVDDPCRRTREFSTVGQNIFVLSSHIFSDFRAANLIEFALYHWYSEISQITLEIMFRYTPPTVDPVSHFVQMMWAETTFVGCGRAFYGTSKSDRNAIIVCNYGKAGNVKGQPVFVKGEPCTKCSNNATCNQKYSSLCGHVRRLRMDRWIEPFALDATNFSTSRHVLALLYGILVINCVV